MKFFSGLKYNIRGLWMALRDPKLLLLGISRFVLVLILTIVAASLILHYHAQILELVWQRPESPWVTWLWYIVSWLLSVFLVGISGVLSFLLSQILFSVVIMDLMSRIVEKKLTGRVEEPSDMPFFKWFIYLIKQEIPRNIVPVTISLLIMVVGWATPLGPVFTFVSSLVTILFLAWDNTDILPARRLLPFKERFKWLMKNIPFHLGFGLPFLVPVANIVVLSYAPVGATLYHLESTQKPMASLGNPDPSKESQSPS